MSIYLDNQVVAHIKDLSLRAKLVAQGARHGFHDSSQRGVGIEFNQFRAYEPGDELNKIDWKLFARSDRYYVREAERESSINVWLMLDCSNSMLEQSADGVWHKLEYAKSLAAGIGYVALQQGDGIGVIGLQENGLSLLPASTGRAHFHQSLIALDNLRGAGTFPETDALKRIIEKARKNALIIVISDFYQQQTEITQWATQMVGRVSDVVTIQLETDDEVNFNYKGSVRFIDRETGQSYKVDTQQAKQGYLDNRAQYNQSILSAMAESSVSHQRINIDAPIAQTIRELLQKISQPRGRK